MIQPGTDKWDDFLQTLAAPPRTCERCGERIPPGSRKDRRTCSVRCRVAEHRKRRASASTSDAPAAPRALNVLHPGPIVCRCGRTIGELVDGTVRLARGQWTGSDGLYWSWNGYAEMSEPVVASPVTIVCPSCRAEVAA